MKVKETQTLTGGFMAGVTQTRVRELEENEVKPADAVEVPDDTPVHDWAAEEAE